MNEEQLEIIKQLNVSTVEKQSDVYVLWNEILGINKSTQWWCNQVKVNGLTQLVQSYLKTKEIVVDLDNIFSNNVTPIVERIISIRKTEAEQRQNANNKTLRVTPNGNMVCIAHFTDAHLGEHCSVEELFTISKKITDTKGFYAINTGDDSDNFIEQRFHDITQTRKLSVDEETQLVVEWYKLLCKKTNVKPFGSTLAVNGGNHNLYTVKQAGLDFTARMLQLLDVPVIYDKHQLRFNLKFTGSCGNTMIKNIFMRHHFSGNCSSNPFGGMIKFVQNNFINDDVPDLLCSGHIHIGTNIGTCTSRGKQVFLSLGNTFKKHDEYAVELGFAPDNDITMPFWLFNAKYGTITPYSNIDEVIDIMESQKL